MAAKHLDSSGSPAAPSGRGEGAHAASMPDLPNPNPELMASLGGFSVVEADPGAGRVRMRFNALRRFCHSNGTTVQGGFITAWLDCAMAHAVHFQSGFTCAVSSLEIKVSFLERVGPGVVFVDARIVRRGRRVAFLEAVLLDENGRQLATASSTAMLAQTSAAAG